MGSCSFKLPEIQLSRTNSIKGLDFEGAWFPNHHRRMSRTIWHLVDDVLLSSFHLTESFLQVLQCCLLVFLYCFLVLQLLMQRTNCCLLLVFPAVLPQFVAPLWQGPFAVDWAVKVEMCCFALALMAAICFFCWSAAGPFWHSTGLAWCTILPSPTRFAGEGLLLAWFLQLQRCILLDKILPSLDIRRGVPVVPHFFHRPVGSEYRVLLWVQWSDPFFWGSCPLLLCRGTPNLLHAPELRGFFKNGAPRISAPPLSLSINRFLVQKVILEVV